MSPSLTTDAPPLDPHAAATLLLPWYANGTLSPEETRQVEVHLGHCPHCRAELEQYRILGEQVRAQPEWTWQPPSGHFERLMADIDRLDTPAVPVRAKLSPWQRLMDWLRETPQPVRWTLAAESLALAMLVLVVWLPGRPVVEPGFETLSSVTTSTRPTGPRLRVGFDPTLRIADLQSLLQVLHGQIVAGPSALGIYTVALDAEGRPEAALDHALTVLRAHHQVLLAEPLQPSK